MADVLVALGANMGDRRANLQTAVDRMRETFDVIRLSRLYRTAPMYVEDQPEFLNGAALVRTDCGPLPILQRLKSIEAEIGRHRSQRFGPREIDLDVLAYGCLRYRFGGDRAILEIPHPRIAERRFVLAPLADVAPDFVLPGLGRVADLLAATNNQANCVVGVDDAVF